MKIPQAIKAPSWLVVFNGCVQYVLIYRCPITFAYRYVFRVEEVSGLLFYVFSAY